MRFNTKVICQPPEPHTGAVITPIFLSSTYVQPNPGEMLAGYEYARGGNPTRQALEDTVARIENGTRAFAFGSGMAAVEAILKLLNPGDEVIAYKDIYGGSYRIFKDVFERYGIKFIFADFDYLEDVERLITDNTKLVWIETPTNPLLNLVDIKAVSALCKRRRIIFAVDNTFASPYIQNPLDLGADIVMHSATKYLSGHSDVVAGIVVVKDDALAERIYFIQYACGAILGPQDSYLVLRGIRTLPLRVQRHCENSQRVAEFLEKHPAIGRVYYPGLKSHPHHELAKRQMKNGFGGVVSFKFASGKKDDALTFLKGLKLFLLADSLGGVESLANHSATMTHASVPEEQRLKMGITGDLLRLSVGVEDIEDLLEDLERALQPLSIVQKGQMADLKIN